MPFSGQLSLDDDERPLEADVEFVGSDLVVSTLAGQMGRWPLALCRIQPENGRFLLTIDNDTAWFVPDDPVRLTRVVSEHWGTSSLATAIKAVRAAAGPLPVQPLRPRDEVLDESDEAPRPSIARALIGLDPVRKWQFAALGLGLALVLVVANIIGGQDPPAASAPSATVLTTTPATPFVFQTGLDGVADRWNDAADRLGTEAYLLLVTTTNRLQTRLTGNLVLYGSEDPATDTVHSLMISSGPAQGEEATAILAVWGNLIAVVNPELDPEGRRAILERLGVGLNRPLTLGLVSETTEAGARYWLRSGVLGGRVLFGVQPNP
jgi:hypothetical protein